jgi:CIC family chloride channel protein
MSPAIDDTGEWEVGAPVESAAVDRRTLTICALGIAIAVASAFLAEVLRALMGLVTNVAFYGRISSAFIPPAQNHLGLWVIIVPVIGGLIVGLMARFGSAAIRGHGIPEVIEKVLYGESRIPARVMFLKPLSAAIAIGTGGPFGAEGPIIATGGALGSIVGQILRVTADERKILLACGAAAGMAATFGSPVSAVLLSIELLLFEYRARSLIPVALAAATAAGVRIVFHGSDPVFAVPGMITPSGGALTIYIAIGAVVGVAGVVVSRLTYTIEDLFERLPIHWMWWPALGGLAVGIVGYFAPRTLGVGYYNITDALGGSVVGSALAILIVLKFVSWSIALGSGTSGGTMAPLFTIGAGLGAILGGFASQAIPLANVDPRVAALVGMAAIFAAASHAPLTSIVLAFETTRQPLGLLPLLGGCAAAYLISLLLSKHSIMTERLARRGAPVRHEYASDHLSHVFVRDAAAREVISVRADDTVGRAREIIEARGYSHRGFPVIDDRGRLVGVVTDRELNDRHVVSEAAVSSLVKRTPSVVFEDNTLREAADHMVLEKVGRLPVVQRSAPRTVTGMLSRSDLLAAHEPRLKAARLRSKKND